MRIKKVNNQKYNKERAIVFNTLLNDVGAEPVIATVPPSVTGVLTATGVVMVKF